MEIKLYKDEKIEDLQYKGLKIIQNKKWFCFGMDSILLSDFSKGIRPNSTVVDLGPGTGIISILLSAKTNASKIICVEKQPEMADIIVRNIELNKLQNKIELINDDILNLCNSKLKENDTSNLYDSKLKETDISNLYDSKLIEEASVDAVVTNPPYKKKETGLKNENEQKYISK